MSLIFTRKNKQRRFEHVVFSAILSIFWAVYHLLGILKLPEGGFEALFVGTARVVFGLQAIPVTLAAVLQVLDHFFGGGLLPGAALGAVSFQGVGQSF